MKEINNKIHIFVQHFIIYAHIWLYCLFVITFHNIFNHLPKWSLNKSICPLSILFWGSKSNIVSILRKELSRFAISNCHIVEIPTLSFLGVFSFNGSSFHQDLLFSQLLSCSILLLLKAIYDFFFDPLPCALYNLTFQINAHIDVFSFCSVRPPPPVICLKASELQLTTLERENMDTSALLMTLSRLNQPHPLIQLELRSVSELWTNWRLESWDCTTVRTCVACWQS